LRLTIGEPVTAEALALLDRTQIARELRRRTMALAGLRKGDPDEVFLWPKHVKW
jgi:hypothetical protein